MSTSMKGWLTAGLALLAVAGIVWVDGLRGEVASLTERLAQEEAARRDSDDRQLQFMAHYRQRLDAVTPKANGGSLDAEATVVRGDR